MRRAAMFAATLTAATMFAASQISAQQAPNFAGTWAVIADANAPAAPPAGGGGGGGGRGGGGRGGGAGLGMGATIVQDGTSLTIVRTTQAGEARSVHRLDGSESRNTVQGRGGAIEQVSKARVDAGKVIITTSLDMGGTAVETTMSLSLDPQGNLVVETTAPGRGGGAPTTTTMRYRKG